MKILIPHVYGSEAVKSTAYYQSGLRRRWDEQSFFEEASKRLSQDEVEALRKLYKASLEISTEVVWGTGKDKGSFNPKVETISARSLFSVYSNGRMNLNYYWLSEDEHAKACGRLFKEKLKAIPPFKDAIERSGKKYPPVILKDWMPYTDAFITLLQEFVRECETVQVQFT